MFRQNNSSIDSNAATEKFIRNPRAFKPAPVTSELSPSLLHHELTAVSNKQHHKPTPKKGMRFTPDTTSLDGHGYTPQNTVSARKRISLVECNEFDDDNQMNDKTPVLFYSTGFHNSSSAFSKRRKYNTSDTDLRKLSKKTAIKDYQRNNPDSSSIGWRVVILTIYCFIQYFLLTIKFWDLNCFNTPESPPQDLLLFNSTDHPHMSKFLSLVHPHIDAHPHLHIPITAAMQRSLGAGIFEWSVMVWLSFITHRRRSNIFGLFVGMLLFMQITGTNFGGLYFKTPLYPDLWTFIFQRLQNSLVNCSFPYHSYLPSNWISVARLIRCPPEALPTATLSAGLYSVVLIYFLDIIGVCMSFLAVIHFLKPKLFLYPMSLLVVLLVISSQFLSGLPRPNSNDHHWVDFKHNSSNILNRPVYLTKYIPMTDGIQLATDVYLPASTVNTMVYKMKLEETRYSYSKKLGIRLDRRMTNSEIKIPTLLIITRYNRRMTVRWPFTLLSLWGQSIGQSTVNVWSWQFVESLVNNNYAVVTVDARGTGASFGNRPIDFAPSELNDSSDITNWIKNQFWYNGHIAAGGFSYDGIAGLQLAGRESLDAVLALFTPIDVVHDLIQPGGMVCSSFVEYYTGLTHSFEQYGSPIHHMMGDFSYGWHLMFGFLIVFGVVAPVKSNEFLLPIAISAHLTNWNMSSLVDHIHFSDDFVWLPSPRNDSNNPESGQTVTSLAIRDLGITKNIAKNILKSKVSLRSNEFPTVFHCQAAVYVVGGYCDSSSVRGSSRLFEFLHDNDPDNKHQLIIGPWTHTGRRNCSPYSGGSYPHFESDMYVDILRFLNCHMRNDCSLDKRDPVHFWSIGEEKWFSSKKFPPVEVTELDMTLGTEINSIRNSYELIINRNSTYGNSIDYEVDYEATTAGLSRWVIAKHPFRLATAFHKRMFPSSDKSNRLLFTTPAINNSFRIAGSPLLRFSLNLTAEFERRSESLRRLMFDSHSLRVNRQSPASALDVTVFGYLEDIDNQTGEIHYVTEGRVLLSHRPTVDYSLNGLKDWDSCVYQPYKMSDDDDNYPFRQTSRIGSPDCVYQPGDQYKHHFSVGGVECIVFTFEPVAWYFKSGHSIRLSLAGADQANFRWDTTRRKEAADFLTLSLLSKIGSTDRLGDLQHQPVHLDRPQIWEMLPGGFLKLPVKN